MSQSNVNQLPDAVQWSEGMLLTPQHFQQYDIYLNAVLQQRMCGITAHCWGVRHLVVDMSLLAGGTLVVEELTCIFPDGVPYVMQAGDIGTLRLSFKPQDLTDGKAVRVCAAMPPRTGAMKVPSTSIKRYESIPGDHAVIDEMTGIADVYVDRIRPKVELYTEQDVPAGYLAVPLIEVTRNVRNGQLEPTSFHPPMLRMGAASVFTTGTSLMRALRQLRDQLWDKMHKLTGMSPVDGPERVGAMSAEERMQLSLARHIASALPMFDTIILDAEVAPAHAYHALAHVVGSMAWVGSNPAPLMMPPYVHDNCAPQFQAAIDFVLRKLALINTEWDSMAFSRVGEMIFARRLPDELRAPVFVEVRLRDGQGLRDVEAWLADARVGSEELMPMLRQRRLPGAVCRLLNSTEVAALGLRGDAVVVRIENQRIELPNQGVVDCIRAGRTLLIQSSGVQHMPAAVLLQLRRGEPESAAPQAAGTGKDADKEAGEVHA